MWVRKDILDSLHYSEGLMRTEVVKLQAVNLEQARRIAAQDTTIDWFRVRISQLEMERAQMLYNYTGVKIATPTIERAPEGDVAKALQAVQGFHDIGDKEAAALGIGWNDDGTLRYATER